MKLAVAHPNDAALKQSVEAVFARYARQASLDPDQPSMTGAAKHYKP